MWFIIRARGALFTTLVRHIGGLRVCMLSEARVKHARVKAANNVWRRGKRGLAWKAWVACRGDWVHNLWTVDP